MNDAKTKPARKASGKDIVKLARDGIQAAWEYDRDNREDAANDLAFLAGDQWPEQVRLERETARRPMLTINRLPQFLRQVTNDIRQADVGIKVSPVDDQSDKDLAEIYNGLLRQIQYQSSAKHVFTDAAEHQASCGIGWFRITSEYPDDTAFEQELRIRRIHDPLSVYCDPGAVEPDRMDAMWMAITEMVPKETFKERYPDAKDVDVELPDQYGSSGFFWTTNEHVRIAEYWRKVPVTKELGLLPDGQSLDISGMSEDMRQMLGIVKTRKVKTHEVESYIVSGAEILSGPHKWAGKHIPIIPVIGAEIPLDGRRYRHGVIRFARDAQQLYNFYRTATAESIGNAPKAPFLATPNMIGKFKGQWDSANTTNRPYLLYEPDPQAPGARPQRERPPDVPAALMQEAQIAADDMKATTGIYDASLGAKSNEQSGRAILARQHEGDVANYHYSDNLSRSLEAAGRVLIDLIPKIYDSERVLRLMGEDGNESMVRINQEIMSEDGTPVLVNDLSAGRFDIRVTIGPSYSTKRIETANSLVEFMRAVPQVGALAADLVAEAMDFPKADQLAERLKRALPPQITQDPEQLQQANQQQQQADPTVQLQLESATHETRKKKAEADRAELQNLIDFAPLMGGGGQPAPAEMAPPDEEAEQLPF